MTTAAGKFEMKQNLTPAEGGPGAPGRSASNHSDIGRLAAAAEVRANDNGNKNDNDNDNNDNYRNTKCFCDYLNSVVPLIRKIPTLSVGGIVTLLLAIWRIVAILRALVLLVVVPLANARASCNTFFDACRFTIDAPVFKKVLCT